MISIFWTCALVVLYAYVLYPVAIFLFAKNKKSENGVASKIPFEKLPDVTVVMAVYNGEENITARLNNIFEANYPIGKINVIVVSDGSTDNTVDVVAAYPSDNVKVIQSENNIGKSGALNLAYDYIETDFVAFCDIRQTFCENALMELASSFTEESIGAVTGNLIIKNDDDNAESDPGLYWKYEKWIRDNEGSVRSLIGVTGAIYMARTKLLPLVLPSDAILDDMYVPLNIVKAGFHVKMANEAYAYDVSSATLKEEFHRKVRTLAGNFQLMKLLPWVNSFRNPLLIQWLSHKLARLMVPYALIGLLLTSSLLTGIFFDLAYAAQFAFYFYAIVSFTLMKLGKTLPLGNIIVSFLTLNYAALLAGWKYYFGLTNTLWKKH